MPELSAPAIKSIMRRRATGDDIDPDPFTYNPLHDLESIWWIATFLIFQYFTIDGHDRQRLDKDVDELFPASQHTSRNTAFTSKTRYKQMIDHLPAELRPHGEQLDLFRRLLIASYQAAESKRDISKAAFDPDLYELSGKAFSLLCEDPGSLAACLNERRKQSSAAGCDEVDKRFEGVESSPSAGKRKKAKKQTSMGDAMLRRSTRPQKEAVHAQQTESDDSEDAEHAKSTQSTKKRIKADDQKDDESYRAKSSQSARQPEKKKEQEGNQSFRVAESSHSARKRKGANEQNLVGDGQRFDESGHTTKKGKRRTNSRTTRALGPPSPAVRSKRRIRKDFIDDDCIL